MTKAQLEADLTQAHWERDQAAHLIELLREQLTLTEMYANRAKEIIASVQAELLAGGSPARLRAIVGIDQETDPNAERS